MLRLHKAMLALVAGSLCLLVLPSTGQGGGGPQPGPNMNKECHGLVGHGTAPLCSGSTCFFLGPYCWDPCTVLDYTGGQCEGPHTQLCTIEPNMTVDEKTCRDCQCSASGLGTCSVDGGTYPSGSTSKQGCRQGG
jgi:hypothetical protein